MYLGHWTLTVCVLRALSYNSVLRTLDFNRLYVLRALSYDSVLRALTLTVHVLRALGCNPSLDDYDYKVPHG